MLLNSGVGEDSWESLDCKEIKSVNSKGNQSWLLIGRTDTEAGGPIFWPPGVKNWLIEKDTDAGKYWRQEKKGMIEGEMVGWRHQIDGHEFEQALEVGDGQGSLACLQSMGSQRVRNNWVTELNWTESIYIQFYILFFVKIFTIMPESLSLFYMLLFHL